MSPPKLLPAEQEPWAVAFFAALIGVSTDHDKQPTAIARRAAVIADEALAEIKKRGVKP